jgi:hypothetical protein
MSALTLPELPAGELRAHAALQDRRIELRLDGAAEYQDPRALDELLHALHEQALGAGITDVDVDLRKLEFINSSCFKSLITWIGLIEELEPARRYRVRFVSDAEMVWQRRSLHALQCFAPDLVVVHT